MSKIRRVLQAPVKRLGVDPKRYWLLVDLYRKLSDRGEMLDQLGASGAGLRLIAGLLAAYSTFICIVMLLARTSSAVYLPAFVLFTGIILLSVLLMETGNSLVNPVEADLLAHQPIDGATYGAAKLTHLVWILLYFVPALNGIPALAGLLLQDALWYYPLMHLAAAFAVGAVAALLCCAVYGWLIRLIPPRRLKAAAQLAAILPLMGFMLRRQLGSSAAALLNLLPASPVWRWALGLAACAAALAIAVAGIRSLSRDYMVRVSNMTRGGSALGARSRRPHRGSLIARLFGGQPGRAGFSFVSRMMLRDYQFRRHAAPMIVAGLGGMLPLLVKAGQTGPFSGEFSAAHVVSHAIAAAICFICLLLPYGNDHKGVWVFLAAPASAFHGFARGVYGALCIPLIVVPHAIMLPLMAVAWGLLHGAMFASYSAVVCFLYLSLALRLIDGPPFSRQSDAARNAMWFPMFLAGAAIVGLAVSVQYFFIFPSPARVAIATVAAGAGAWLLTRLSLRTYEASIRHNLGLVSLESGTLYREIL